MVFLQGVPWPNLRWVLSGPTKEVDVQPMRERCSPEERQNQVASWGRCAPRHLGRSVYTGRMGFTKRIFAIFCYGRAHVTRVLAAASTCSSCSSADMPDERSSVRAHGPGVS